MPRPQYQFPTIPPELMLVIIEMLPHDEQQKFCLLSHSSRQLALPSVFRSITYSQYLPDRIEKLNGAGEDVKAAIKELILNDDGWRTLDYEAILFPFLKSLPNLRCFRWSNYYRLSDCLRGFHQLVASLQHCPLEHFSYRGFHAQSEPITAPRQLKSLSFSSNHNHLYDLIQPSFSTLVGLEIYPHSPIDIIDLLRLRPVGNTLREFVYKLDGFDPEILDTIPNAFPYLTSLVLVVQRTSQNFVWKNSYDDALAKNTKLQYLGVSAKRFTFCDPDIIFPHTDCEKCGTRRVEATRTLAIACTELKHCWWEHPDGRFCFNVRLSGQSSEGNLPVRVEQVSDQYIPELFKYRCDSCGGYGVISCRRYCR